MKARLLTGDCLERLRELPDASVASVVTDPPYGLGFIGVDLDPKHVAIAEARLRNAGGLFVEIEVG